MENRGIIRRIDDLGRIVLPVEMRKLLEITRQDDLEVTVRDDEIIIQKRADRCVFCGAREELQNFRGKALCRDCFLDILALSNG